MRYTVWVDGAARGNPGPAAVGIVLEAEPHGARREVGLFLGTATNNVAEYLAALAGLQLAARAGAKSVVLKSDSELLVKQLRGEYRVRAGHLQGLCTAVRAWLGRFDSATVEHVPRTANQDADAAANLALDAAEALPPRSGQERLV